MLDLERGAAQEIADLGELLREHGLLRADGTRDTAAAKDRMLDVSQREGLQVRNTKSGAVCLDSDACRETLDPVLEAYSGYSSAKKVLTNDVQALRGGLTHPISTTWKITDTGRVSSSRPNTMNPRRMPGVRECYVPRPGKIFATADYDGLELRTMAQACLWLVGHSRLAELLNAGADPHLELGAALLGISYEQAEQRLNARKEALKRGEPDPDLEIDNARQAGKVGNFGNPGGLGPAKMVLYARKSYKVRITEERAKQIKQIWLERRPEFVDYFKVVQGWVGGYGGRCAFKHFVSNRVRGGARFTEACNSLFQGLGADATGAALFQISEACYALPESPLYGSRMVNYMHDDFLIECDPECGHEVATELVRVMVDAAQPFIPDVPATAEPKLMRYWSKDAQKLTDGNGRLIPWPKSK